jgi:exodeoxyribonuclease-5
LHSVCGLRLTENDDGTTSIASTGNPMLDQFDLLVVDESSMIDAKMLLRSIQSSRGNCLVLFIGDPAQLPPVTEGVVAKVFKLPQGWMLDKVVRQARDNPLIAASMHIRKRSRVDDILAAPSERESQRVIQALGHDDRVQASELMDLLPSDSFIRGTGRLRELALDLQRQGIDARILCYTNNTVLANNESIHFDLHPEAGNLMFVPGERVIVQSATKAENIDTGKTVELVTSEELTVEDVELTQHPQYTNTKVYQLVMQDDLGNLVKVYTPKLMTAFRHQTSKLFGEVNEINRLLNRTPGDKLLREKLNQTRNAAWAYKNSFAEIRHNFSSTVHKAQGATVKIALIDLPDIMRMQSTFLFNSALYVAITRPSDRVYIAY